MKSVFLSLAVIAILFGCSSKHSDYSGEATGKITGNIYWKYNNYVGNKPDAGANVYLYTTDTSKPYQSTTCDVQGNFSFSQLQDGPYLIVVRSENTTASPYNYFMYVDDDSLTEKYLHFSLRSVNPTLYDSAQFNDSVYMKTSTSMLLETEYGSNERAVFEKKATVLQDLSFKYADSTTSSIPKTEAFKPFEKIGTYPKKIKLKEVNVKNGQAAAVNVDFGETYL